jgi:hypothetical protein
MNLATPLTNIEPSEQYLAVSVLAAQAAKRLGGGRIVQNRAAQKARQMLTDGFTAATAIELAAKMTVRWYNKDYPWQTI